MYDLDLYSRNESLGIFLKTLSYHRVGANFLSRTLSEKPKQPIMHMLDIGCGEGTFIVALFEAMQRLGVTLPRTISAFDPDPENLRSYQSRLAQFAPAELRTRLATLEDAHLDEMCDLIVCSHSLYGTLENPTLSDAEKILLLRKVLGCVGAGGTGFMSLASRHSEAYRVKRKILARLDMEDRSVHGEELQPWLIGAGSSAKGTLHYSYMDVTFLMQNEAAMVKWLSYFARVPEGQIWGLGMDPIKKIFESHARCFSDMDSKTQLEMKSFPADIGEPNSETLFLPHCEIFFVT
jgi:SAM-dependent methyltransferase